MQSEAGTVNDLHVDGHLATMVADDEDTNAAAARLKGLLEAAAQAALVNDGEALLDVTGLGHGDDGVVLDVKDAVLLEDRTEHGLDNNAGSGVGDEGGLLVQLLGEEVDTKVAVLTSGSRGRDADDLARAALEDEDISETDVVAGDGHGVGRGRILRGATSTGLTDLGDLNVALWVQDTVSQLVNSVTERVVVS